jgi:hypothetical protein
MPQRSNSIAGVISTSAKILITIFDFLGWQSPALGAIRSGLGDQGSGDIVEGIASVVI